MPVTANNMMGLVILSLGVLGIIISFLITDRKKYLVAMVLALLIVVTGAYQYVSTGIRQWQTARRIASLQKQQRLNLEALQERLRQAQQQAVEKGGRPAPAAPAKK
ncbi:MAG TPA: hypothetical protein P5079_03640 [Elusimicrobiota bacterium]|nr:hypothetical protein [Elusimicrobiota bacterium]